MSQTFKKLAVVLATSILMTIDCKESFTTLVDENSPLLLLERIPYIYYPVRFKKDKAKVQILLDSSSKINAITPVYVASLDLKVRATDIEARKIDGSTFETFEMVLASFQVEDKLGKARFIQETILLADTNMAIIHSILFLIFSNANVLFVERKLTWRSYTLAEALPTTKLIEITNKKEFAKVVLDENSKTFVMHITALQTQLASAMTIHLSQLALITIGDLVQISILQ